MMQSYILLRMWEFSSLVSHRNHIGVLAAEFSAYRGTFISCRDVDGVGRDPV